MRGAWSWEDVSPTPHPGTRARGPAGRGVGVKQGLLYPAPASPPLRAQRGPPPAGSARCRGSGPARVESWGAGGPQASCRPYARRLADSDRLQGDRGAPCWLPLLAFPPPPYPGRARGVGRALEGGWGVHAGGDAAPLRGHRGVAGTQLVPAASRWSSGRRRHQAHGGVGDPDPGMQEPGDPPPRPAPARPGPRKLGLRELFPGRFPRLRPGPRSRSSLHCANCTCKYANAY